MRKKVPYIIVVVGVILVCVGIFLQVPSKELTTYSILRDSGYSVIEEYVGGDAYNFIIGASLVAGEIAGTMIQKAVFISVGLLIACVGLIECTKQNNGGQKKQGAQLADIQEVPLADNQEVLLADDIEA